MNDDQMSSTIRSVLKVLGGVLVSLGVTDGVQAGIIVDVLMVIVGTGATVWGSWGSWKAHKPTIAPKP